MLSRRQQRRRLLRLLVWRVVVMGLPLSLSLSLCLLTAHSPTLLSLRYISLSLFFLLLPVPPLPPTNTYVFISSSYSHTLPTRYLFCRRRCLCLRRRRRLCRFAFLLVFYYYYFSRYSLFCSPVSLEKFNFYFFVFFYVYLPSAFCVRTYVCVCLTLSIFYDYFSFLCVTFYIFFIAPFFVLFCLSRLTLVALSAAFSMPACGSPPSPHIFTFVFSVFHSSRCLSIEFAVSLTLSVCVFFLFFALLFICISYFKHFSCTRISQKSRFTFTFYVALLFALRRVVTHMSALPLLHSFIRFHFVICTYVCVATFAGRFQSKIAFFPFYV